MSDFKAPATYLLEACAILAPERPALDAGGKAIDRPAFMAWRSKCHALALTLAEKSK
jgi:hypothetical protein